MEKDFIHDLGKYVQAYLKAHLDTFAINLSKNPNLDCTIYSEKKSTVDDGIQVIFTYRVNEKKQIHFTLSYDEYKPQILIDYRGEFVFLDKVEKPHYIVNDKNFFVNYRHSNVVELGEDGLEFIKSLVNGFLIQSVSRIDF